MNHLENYKIIQKQLREIIEDFHDGDQVMGCVKMGRLLERLISIEKVLEPKVPQNEIKAFEDTKFASKSSLA